MRILAVDYGERRTGLAVSDELGITAQGLDTIETQDESQLPKLVAEAANKTGAVKILVGLPLNMDGSESDKSRKVRLFAAELIRISSLPVVLWDERMSSIQAHRVLRELGKKTYKNKQVIDRISATLMLQEFMKTIP